MLVALGMGLYLAAATLNQAAARARPRGAGGGVVARRGGRLRRLPPVAELDDRVLQVELAFTGAAAALSAALFALYRRA